jgi:hypothetical protein
MFPKPFTVDISCAEEIYPRDPNPIDVDCNSAWSTNPFTVEINWLEDIYPRLPNPTKLDVIDDCIVEIDDNWLKGVILDK